MSTRLTPLRRRLYRQLEPAAWGKDGISPANRLFMVAILVAVLSAVLETEPLISQGRAAWFRIAELIFGILFVGEYLLRAWAAAENPRYGGGWRSRWHYLKSPVAMIDLLAIVPTFLPWFGSSLMLLRLLRILRILRLARLGPFSLALSHLGRAIHARRHELLLTLGLALLLMLTAATVLYWVEGAIQPDKFGSIPRALWWAAVTLTTIGYGDVYPVTALGKLCATITSLSAIGLIAMPTGILAAAFSDAVQQFRRDEP